MNQARTSWSEDEARAVREQLLRIVESELFVQGPRQSRFLTYIVDATLEGKADRLNQFAVGIEVFDRDESFDPSTDSIVRVEAGRLRAKLVEYYSRLGRNDTVVITLPKGGYGASFEFRSGPAAPRQRAPRTRPAFSAANLVIGLVFAGIIVASFYIGFFTSPRSDDADDTNAPMAATRPRSGIPAIAVLPFDNMTDDPAQEYFSDGITEDIITDLSIVSNLTVIARHSTFVYKDQPVSISDIGRDLNVQYLLEGSVRRDGTRLRINAQLIDVASETHLWAERFDRELDDVFAVQDEVSRRIVDALDVTLTDLEFERLGHHGTDSIEAHDLYLPAQEQFYRFSADGVMRSIDLFAQAVEKDPAYAEALAWQSRVLTYAFIAGIEIPEQDSVSAALALAERAVSLDEFLAMGYANLGWAQRWAGAPEIGLRNIARAIELDPNFADAYLWRSLILSVAGRGEEAMSAIEQAFRNNPNYGVTYIFALGRAHLTLGNLEEALRQFDRGIERNPDFVPPHVFKMAVLEALGRDSLYEQARQHLERTNPNYRQSAAYIFYLRERSGAAPTP